MSAAQLHVVWSVPGLLVCSSHLVECGGEGLIACSFCLRVCCSIHLYCPCDRAAARRLYVTTEDAKKAAVGASKAARKASRAVSAARSIELAASRFVSLMLVRALLRPPLLSSPVPSCLSVGL